MRVHHELSDSQGLAIAEDGEVICAGGDLNGLQGARGEVVDEEIAIGEHVNDIGAGTLRDCMEYGHSGHFGRLRGHGGQPQRQG